MSRHAVEGTFTLSFDVAPEVLVVEGERFARPTVRISYNSICEMCRGVLVSEWWYNALKKYLGVDELPFEICGCSNDIDYARTIHLSDIKQQEESNDDR